ncbi:MAG TPA: DNA-3-methyladenine glycosylase [Lentimicrobium sp.]|nr:DNA-3-methyladenine glycosylase [Lentimicrobium sp.]
MEYISMIEHISELADNNNRLPPEFYKRDNVIAIARELLGKELVSFAGERLTSGIITETEAYNGIVDKASHAYGDRRTKRTETMYHEGGVAYIYLCYGIHSLLNVVTNIKDVPHAVLIRAILPVKGIEIMEERIGRRIKEKEGQGPGKVTKLLGLTYADNGDDLIGGNKLWIEETNMRVSMEQILITPRIGVDYAKEDALLPYRFVLKSIK